MKKISETLVIIRGGGDIATGSIQKLFRAGFKLLILDIEKPSAIRRRVAFCEAIYDGECTIEGIKSVFCKNKDEIEMAWEERNIPIVVDPKGEYIKLFKPDIVVDAILAKKNMGTEITMAPGVVGLGPGFDAGKNCHIAIETMRGHNLGRVIFSGPTMANTGTPGVIKGVGKERVIYSPAAGKIKNIAEIGDIVEKGQTIATIDEVEVSATISGVLRGLIRDEYEVPEHFKIADIDPRIEEQQNCFTISDKARAVGGAVLEAVLILLAKNSK